MAERPNLHLRPLWLHRPFYMSELVVARERHALEGFKQYEPHCVSFLLEQNVLFGVR